MAINTASASGPRAEINVTPMIDVLLVLLIIFMSIAPRQAVGLDALAPAPASASTPESPENPVVLEIAADGSYLLNTTRIAATALAERLSAIYARRSQRILFVKAPPDLEFQTVATALDIAHTAAIDRVALLPR
jgi:biopolymer transport protein ExbD